MRTTLTIDDDVAARLRAEARRTGRSFKELVNEHLRLGLARRRELRSAPSFQVTPVNLGGPLPGLAYDDVSALLEQAEDDKRA